MLGERMYLRVLVVRGKLDETEWQVFVRDAVAAIGMTPAYSQTRHDYPANGKGGNGLQVYQPITESFIALETWPDFNGAYLIVCSCKPFSAQPLHALLARYGLQFERAVDTDVGFDA